MVNIIEVYNGLNRVKLYKEINKQKEEIQKEIDYLLNQIKNNLNADYISIIQGEDSDDRYFKIL